MNKNTITTIAVIAITIGIGVLVAFSGDSPKEKKSNVGSGSVTRESAYSKGNKDAKIQIVEFSDLQCPACKLSEPELQKVFQTYGEDIYFQYRHFPLMQHPLSTEAAQAAEAAGIQGKFWEMHDIIFENQENLSREIFVEFARGLSLDIAKYESDVKSEAVADIIETDKADAKSLEVTSTPTFFINGEKIKDGGLYFDEWKTEIDKRLSQ